MCECATVRECEGTVFPRTSALPHPRTLAPLLLLVIILRRRRIEFPAFPVPIARFVFDGGGRLPVGVDVAATPALLAREGTAIEPMQLRAGDVVLFSDATGAVVHAGLYLGAGQFVHAPGPSEAVTISSMYDPLWASSYAGARRLSA